MTRVLLWAPHGAGEHYNGAGTNAYRLYRAMRKFGTKVTLVHGSDSLQQRSGFDEVVCLGKLKPRTLAGTAKFLLKSWSWIKQNHGRFDVFHGLHVYETTLWPATWAEALGMPAFLKMANQNEGIGDVSLKARILGMKFIRVQLMKKVTKVVAISEAIKREILEAGIPSKKILAVPNGVDTSRFRPIEFSERLALRDAMGISRDDFMVLFVGGITPRKQPDWLLQAIRRLKDLGISARLVIAGPVQDDAYWEKIKTIAADMGVLQRISHVGHVSNIQCYYQVADLFALPSQNEGFPNALLEAAACGLPSICTKVSGCYDLLNDGQAGRLVNTPEEISDAAQFFARNCEARENTGKMARHYIMRDYELGKIAKGYHDYFSTLPKRYSVSL